MVCKLKFVVESVMILSSDVIQCFQAQLTCCTFLAIRKNIPEKSNKKKSIGSIWKSIVLKTSNS